MSDPRWLDVDSDVAGALLHFGRAVDIHRAWTTGVGDRDFYILSMAFMHAMLAGHTSVEVALVWVLDLLDEEKPSGPDWHQMLITRMARSLEGEYARPALLTSTLAKALKENKDFRHRALHTYDDFDFDRARPAVEAAIVIAEEFPRVILAFKDKIDPAP